ncbi:MAG TPA: HAMP domain-containing sensor histidine kinase [Stellaceae bacterium]|jgi:signal transduction histidine kinase|nr:HAMP domain-containing sensor histidine kinase [Stellaceae bacterium]
MWRLLGQIRRLVKTHAFRLASLYFAVFAVSVLGVLLSVYLMSADFVERQTQATLEAEIAGLAEQYAQRGISGLVQIVAARSAGDRGDGVLYLVTNAEGHPLAGNITGWPEGTPVSPGPVSFRVAMKEQGVTRTHPAQGALIVIPEGYRLLVARDISDAALYRQRIKMTLVWSGLVALVAGLFGGAVMSRNLLRRVEQVNRTAERVMGGNLADRVPLKGTRDEFDQLAANLNNMLDQIERLMAGMREVSDNIAHDLRTPLARLRARLELSLIANQNTDGQNSSGQNTNGPEDGAQTEAVRAAIDEADRLLATFNALLNIAEAESGARRNQAEPLDLAQTVRSAAELYEPVAEEKGCALRLDVEPGIMIRGDRHLLSQAVANLLDNALKYGGGEVRLSAHQQDGRAALEVSDMGPGIPEEEREAVFDRFVRLEPSRSTPGNGLGLSLVRAVARLHNGTVALGDNQPGLKVRLEFAAL